MRGRRCGRSRCAIGSGSLRQWRGGGSRRRRGRGRWRGRRRGWRGHGPRRLTRRGLLRLPRPDPEALARGPQRSARTVRRATPLGPRQHRPQGPRRLIPPGAHRNTLRGAPRLRATRPASATGLCTTRRNLWVRRLLTTSTTLPVSLYSTSMVSVLAGLGIIHR